MCPTQLSKIADTVRSYRTISDAEQNNIQYLAKN